MKANLPNPQKETELRNNIESIFKEDENAKVEFRYNMTYPMVSIIFPNKITTLRFKELRELDKIMSISSIILNPCVITCDIDWNYNKRAR
ncbi:MAG: hypothetical protein P0116_11640 [Candidatus Nitrosocosmicus sp.]|nr:hypothetical protein [Candidatus Nitrosocosmicus sp.]